MTTTTPTRLTKGDVIESLVNKLNVSKAQATNILDSFVNIVQENMIKGNEITLTGFGTFKVTTRSARDGVNPKTGAKLKIAATKGVRFQPGKTLKDAVKAS